MSSPTILTFHEAGRLLAAGSVGVIPTDTVYGLAARADLPQAVTRLYALKQRERKPGTIIAAHLEQLVQLGLDQHTLGSVAHLWPGPLSIVLPVSSSYLDQGVGSLAVRIVADETVHRLLSYTGPLVTSSANLPGRPESQTIAEAINYFGEAVDFYVDGGANHQRQASTVARLLPNGHFEVLRQGAYILPASE